MSITIEMPKLSDTMSVGTVVKWHRKVGDKVTNGDTLAEIETDKATMELENFDDGILLKILVNEGEEAPIGSPLAIVGEEGEEIKENKEESLPSKEQSALSEEGTEDENLLKPKTPFPVDDHPVDNPEIFLHPDQEETVTASSSRTRERIFASPLARKIASDRDIDLSDIEGSGPSGRIIKKDILANESIMPVLEIPAQNQNESEADELIPSLSSPELQPNSLLVSKSVPLNRMRSVIAKRLSESKTTICLLYTSPSPRDPSISRMPSSA